MEHLRYPIGKAVKPTTFDSVAIAKHLNTLADFPTAFRAVAESLTPTQLATPYRPGGWTARQVIHHVPDSHINSYVRFRWALTEDEPTIKAYDEVGWAELPDARTAPINLSLQLLDSVHARWVELLRQLTPDDLHRALIHPVGGKMYLYEMVSHYVWHGNHHLAHLELVKLTKGN